MLFLGLASVVPCSRCLSAASCRRSADDDPSAPTGGAPINSATDAPRVARPERSARSTGHERIRLGTPYQSVRVLAHLRRIDDHGLQTRCRQTVDHRRLVTAGPPPPPPRHPFVQPMHGRRETDFCPLDTECQTQRVLWTSSRAFDTSIPSNWGFILSRPCTIGLSRPKRLFGYDGTATVTPGSTESVKALGRHGCQATR